MTLYTMWNITFLTERAALLRRTDPDGTRPTTGIVYKRQLWRPVRTSQAKDKGGVQYTDRMTRAGYARRNAHEYTWPATDSVYTDNDRYI